MYSIVNRELYLVNKAWQCMVWEVVHSGISLVVFNWVQVIESDCTGMYKTNGSLYFMLLHSNIICVMQGYYSI